MPTKAQKEAAKKKKKKEKETKRLAKIEEEKKATAAEKRKAKAVAKKETSLDKSGLHSMVIAQNEKAIDLLTEISITMNSILDHLQSQGGILHGGDTDVNIHINGDIDTTDDDPPEEIEIDDAAHIKQAVRIALAKVGSDKVTKLFKSYNIDRISDLIAERYAPMLNDLEAL